VGSHRSLALYRKPVHPPTRGLFRPTWSTLWVHGVATWAHASRWSEATDFQDAGVLELKLSQPHVVNAYPRFDGWIGGNISQAKVAKGIREAMLTQPPVGWTLWLAVQVAGEERRPVGGSCCNPSQGSVHLRRALAFSQTQPGCECREPGVAHLEVGLDQARRFLFAWKERLCSRYYRIPSEQGDAGQSLDGG